jgi:hypothetical protein
MFRPRLKGGISVSPVNNITVRPTEQALKIIFDRLALKHFWRRSDLCIPLAIWNNIRQFFLPVLKIPKSSPSCTWQEHWKITVFLSPSELSFLRRRVIIQVSGLLKIKICVFKVWITAQRRNKSIWANKKYLKKCEFSAFCEISCFEGLESWW